jgi:hypothetical protein
MPGGDGGVRILAAEVVHYRDLLSDLVVIFGSPRAWLPAPAVCFPLHVFEFSAHLIEPLVKFSSLDLYSNFAALTDDVRLGLRFKLANQE